MNDRDRISTRQLNRLRRRILRVYGTARREMQEQLTEFLTKYKQLDERRHGPGICSKSSRPEKATIFSAGCQH